jgi:Second Messenger Oligonucleotide or Dinucleotide Synthetase domain
MITENDVAKWGETLTPQRRDAWESLLLEIDSRISLTASQYAGLESRYATVGTILENPQDLALGDLLVFPQGSFRTRTVTRPPGREDVDIDAIAYVKGGTDLHPMDLLERLFRELDARVRTGGTVKPAKRCVTIQYEDKQLPCHMDITPAERIPSNPNDDGTGRLRVPDRPTQGWSPSNPKDYADWFEHIASLDVRVSIPDGYREFLTTRAETESLPTHEEVTAPDTLRTGVRLFKRHRDVYVARTGQEAAKPISVIITTLAAKAFERVATRRAGQTMTPMEIWSEIVSEMPHCFDAGLPGEQYRLENPADKTENFAEKWNTNPDLPRVFSAWQLQLERTLRYGYINFPSRERFRDALTGVFGKSAGVACDEVFASIRSGIYPGLSEAAAMQARIAGQSAALIGLGRSEPTVASKPKPLNRLG